MALWHMMEKVVFLVKTCEEAWPESVLAVNALSLLQSEHDCVPPESQKILVREPEETAGGEAQISARSGPRYCGGGGGGGRGDTGGFGEVTAVVRMIVRPTEKPREVQRLSKNDDGRIKEIKDVAQGRAVHIPCTTVAGEEPGTTVYP